MAPRKGRKIAILAAGSLLCPPLAALAALQVTLWTLPPSDGAHGLSLLEVLRSPAVLAVLFWILIPAALLGFAASLYFLWRTEVTLTVPFVAAVTIATAGAFGWLHLFAALPTLAAGLLAMLACRERAAPASDG